MLNDISPFWAFILVVTSLCVFLAYWAWVISGYAVKWKYLSTTILRVWFVLSIIFVVLITPPFYTDYLINGVGCQ